MTDDAPTVPWTATAEQVAPASAWERHDRRNLRYRPGLRRAGVTIGLLALVGVLRALAAGWGLYGFAVLLPRIEAGVITDAEIGFTEGLDGAFAVMIAATTLALVAAWLGWLSRTVENTPRLGLGMPLSSPGGSIGWWFVPLVNLVRPYQIVADLYDRFLGRASRPDHGLLVAWWLTFIAAWVADRFAFATLGGANDIIGVRQALLISIAGDLLTVGAAVLAIALVGRIRDAEQRIASEMPAAGASA